MTNKQCPPVGVYMNRMMSDDYETRGMATAHLRQAMARADQVQSTQIPPIASAQHQSESTNKNG